MFLLLAILVHIDLQFRHLFAHDEQVPLVRLHLLVVHGLSAAHRPPHRLPILLLLKILLICQLDHVVMSAGTATACDDSIVSLRIPTRPMLSLP